MESMIDKLAQVFFSISALVIYVHVHAHSYLMCEKFHELISVTSVYDVYV